MSYKAILTNKRFRIVLSV